MRWNHTQKAIARLAICTVAVVAVTAVLYVLPLRDRPLTAALTFIFVVLIVAAVWGFRYSVFVASLEGLAFSWLAPPAGRFVITDSRDLFALAAFLVIGIIGSYLSARARREAVNANRRGADAVAAQQQFADLVNSVVGIVWEADASTFKFSFVSQQAERVLGYPVNHWLSEPSFWKDHIHPDDREWAVDYCVKATAEKRNHDFEYRMIAADGRVVWLRDIVTVVVEDDQATKLRGMMVDITKRKQADEELREQADLLNLTHDSVFVRDANDVITYWNRGAEELYGWAKDEAVGKVSHDLTQTIFPAPLEEINEELLRTRRWEGELTHTKRDGTQLVVASRWSLQRDEHGTPLAILETNNDVTDRKRVEAALRESEEQWRAVFENNPTMYFMLDANGTILSVNQFGAEKLGYTVKELIGTPVLDIFHEAERNFVQSNAVACLEQLGQAMNWEARKVRKDGSVLWVRETAKAVLLKNRPVVLVVCQDITDRKRAEEALEKSQAELAHVTRVTTMGELTSSIAHEVNQPLAAIVTSGNACLRWLAISPPDLDEARVLVTRIVSDGHRASEVIGRVRALFKKTDSNRSRLHMNDLIQDVLALIPGELRRNRIVLRTELAPDLPSVMGDRIQLQQVLLNLIINGIEAMGAVNDRPRKLGITSRRQDPASVLVAIEDSGIGIDTQNSDRIFDAFITTKREGLGMGLSISRTIIEAHGGHLWTIPNQGRGATFQFTLPIGDA